MRVRKSHLWAGVITLAIAGWLASGEIFSRTFSEVSPEETGAIGAQTDARDAQPAFKVEVREITAQPRRAVLSVRGRTEALRRVEVRARTSGIVEEVAVREGERVEAGALLCRLDIGAREAELAQAKARLASAKIERDAADKLAGQQFVAKTKQAAAQADYDAALAAVEQIERDIGYTTIAAPVAGVIGARPAEAGSLLQPAGVCAQLLVLDPMLVVGQVSEREVAKLKPGMAGSAQLVTGQTVEGTVRHVAPSADETTRTFRVELEVDNDALELRDGVTADIRVPLEGTLAHRFSPALLTLNDAGEVGVRVVDDNDVVAFVPVTILSDDAEGVWVDGLPETVRLITVGQEYVVEGETVETVTLPGSGDAKTAEATP